MKHIVVQYPGNRRWIIWLSFLIGMILENMPWPEQFIYYQPIWLVLILIYWIIALPYLVSIGTSFFLGVFIDLLQCSSLGAHALAYSIICYLVSYKYKIFRNMALYQQSFIIAVLLVIMNFIILLVEYFPSLILFHHKIFLNCFINAIFWPWIFSFLRKIRRQFLVY